MLARAARRRRALALVVVVGVAAYAAWTLGSAAVALASVVSPYTYASARMRVNNLMAPRCCIRVPHTLKHTDDSGGGDDGGGGGASRSSSSSSSSSAAVAAASASLSSSLSSSPSVRALFARWRRVGRSRVGGVLSPRFLVMRANRCGLGNMLMTFNAAVYASLLLGRTLLVDWNVGLSAATMLEAPGYDWSFESTARALMPCGLREVVPTSDDGDGGVDVTRYGSYANVFLNWNRVPQARTAADADSSSFPLLTTPKAPARATVTAYADALLAALERRVEFLILDEHHGLASHEWLQAAALGDERESRLARALANDAPQLSLLARTPAAARARLETMPGYVYESLLSHVLRPGAAVRAEMHEIRVLSARHTGQPLPPPPSFDELFHSATAAAADAVGGDDDGDANDGNENHEHTGDAAAASSSSSSSSSSSLSSSSSSFVQIGVQLRTASASTSGDPGKANRNDDVNATFGGCIAAMRDVLRTRAPARTLRVFVAGDSPQASRQLATTIATRVPDALVFTNVDAEAVHTGFQHGCKIVGSARDKTWRATLNTLAEFFLLATHSHAIVHTGWSTFGYSAATLAGADAGYVRVYSPSARPGVYPTLDALFAKCANEARRMRLW